MNEREGKQMKRLNFLVQGDYIGLSSDEKPTDNVEDGSTLYCVDTKEMFMFYKGTWYEM